MSWYDVWSPHFRRKNKKKPPLGYIFSGVNKKLLLQSQVGPTRCTKSLQKTLTSKRYITFALIATTHYPGARRFSWFFFFCEAAKMSRDSCSPIRGSLAALSCGEKSRKTSVTRVTTHKQKKDAFLNTPASIIMLEFQQNRRKPQVMKFVFSYLI